MGDSPGVNNKLDDSAAVELTGKIMVAAIIILFLVVVFVLLLHLYAKWFWWRIEDSTNPSREARSSRRRRHGFVFTPGQDPAVSALRRGLDPSVLRSLPVVVFRPEEFKEGLECAVCLSELGAGEKARMLPKCDHGFHVDCIDMWFQSHSTCPLCRNPVAPDSSNAASSIELPETNQSAENQNTSGYSTDSSPNFPTNVLFWGNQTRVSAGVLSLEEGPSSQPPASSSSSSSSTGSSSRPDGMLVIDIPRQLTDNFPSSSPSASRFAEEEAKSPMPTRLRSLKRLLSREKRTVVPSSPTSVDVEQGGVGRG